MKHETFDIDYWINYPNNSDNLFKNNESAISFPKNQGKIRKNSEKTPKKSETIRKTDELWQAADRITTEIEVHQLDITQHYTDWRDIGFALSDAFGYEGLELYQRISRFYPGYNETACKMQFIKCLHAGNTGITIRTFFYMAQRAGISLPTPLAAEKEQRETLPTIPDQVYETLPQLLQTIVEAARSQTERDLLLLGSIVTFSSSLPNVYGIYDRRIVYPNLYLFITAKASAGKGILNHCRTLVKKIHEDLREESKRLKEIFQAEINKYNQEKKDNPDTPKPVPPPEKMLFLPANSSATGMFQLLDDNEGKGLMFETEGDTLANTFKSDYGNYSDGFRKAFHHEEMSYYRRTDREHVEIESPRLSTVLSGTPKQIVNLIPDAENGLFSRFMFYHLDLKAEWHNVFDMNYDNGLSKHFTEIGILFYEHFEYLKKLEPFQFILTPRQIEAFNHFFQLKQQWYIEHVGDDYTATIRRLGLIAYRIAMVLSVLRIERTGVLTDKLECSDQDFEITTNIIETLFKHSEFVFHTIQQNRGLPQITLKKQEEFFKHLPSTFTRKDYVEIATSLHIPDKTAQHYISELVKGGMVQRQKHGEYILTKS